MDELIWKSFLGKRRGEWEGAFFYLEKELKAGRSSGPAATIWKLTERLNANKKDLITHPDWKLFEDSIFYLRAKI